MKEKAADQNDEPTAKNYVIKYVVFAALTGLCALLDSGFTALFSGVVTI